MDSIWWDANIFPDEAHSSKSSVTNKTARYYTNYRTYTFTQYYIDYYRNGETADYWKENWKNHWENSNAKTSNIIDKAYNE